MLTGDLVRATVKQKTILPRFLEPDDPALLELARDLTALFAAHMNHERGELRAALEARASSGDRVRLERGLAKLLDDRATFERPSTLDPEQTRALVYERAALARAAGTFDRAAVL